MLKIPKFRSEIAIHLDEVPKILKDSYLHSLDGLRALSILVVISAHIGMAYKSYDHYLHPIARLGVQFFFVISGFLITTLLMKEKVLNGTISLKRFYIRRFFRIVPVAYLYLFFILIINALSSLNMSYYSILLSFLFIRNFSINSRGYNNLSAHYWSLSVEEQFYLIFPLILKKNIMYFTIFLTIMILFPVVSDIYSLYYKSSNPKRVIIEIVNQFFNQFQAIAVGSICSIFLFKKRVQTVIYIKNTTFVTLLFFVIIVLLFFQKNSLFSINNMMVSFLFAAIIIINLQKSTALSFLFFNNKYMKYIGILSYSMYIWQQPFAYSLTFVKKLRFFQTYNNYPLAYILVSLGSAITIFVVSYVSYFFYEKQFLKLKNKFK